MEIGIEKVENILCGIERGRPMSFKEADGGNVNPFFEKWTATAENCQSCVACFKARLDGFDVRAKPFDSDNAIMVALADNTRLAWIDKKTGVFPEYIKPNERLTSQLLNWFDKNLEKDKYYTIEYSFKNAMGGHVMLAFNRRGNITFYDPQTNEVFTGKSIEGKLDSTRRNSIKLINISDCFLNKSVVESVVEVQNGRVE